MRRISRAPTRTRPALLIAAAPCATLIACPIRSGATVTWDGGAANNFSTTANKQFMTPEVLRHLFESPAKAFLGCSAERSAHMVR